MKYMLIIETALKSVMKVQNIVYFLFIIILMDFMKDNNSTPQMEYENFCHLDIL